MQARIIVLLLAAALAGIAIAPDLLLQIFIRGGLVIGGIAITLALRPTENEKTPELVEPGAYSSS